MKEPEIHAQDIPAFRILTQRIPALDGLRAIAILAVVGFHAHLPSMMGGFVGVDVFFVLSGFLITGLIVDQADRGHFSYTRFYAGRSLRIIPPLLIVLVSTLVIALFFPLLPSTFAEFGRTAYVAALFVSNFYFYQHSGYFAVSADYQPFIHTWSLSVEEQYYLVAPIALVLLCRFARNRKANRDHLGMLFCLATFVFSCTIMIFLSYGSTHANAFAFYSSLTRIFQFATGAFLFFAFNIRSSNFAALTQQQYLNLISAAGIGLLGYAIFFSLPAQ